MHTHWHTRDGCPPPFSLKCMHERVGGAFTRNVCLCLWAHAYIWMQFHTTGREHTVLLTVHGLFNVEFPISYAVVPGSRSLLFCSICCLGLFFLLLQCVMATAKGAFVLCLVILNRLFECSLVTSIAHSTFLVSLCHVHNYFLDCFTG